MMQQRCDDLEKIAQEAALAEKPKSKKQLQTWHGEILVWVSNGALLADALVDESNWHWASNIQVNRWHIWDVEYTSNTVHFKAHYTAEGANCGDVAGGKSPEGPFDPSKFIPSLCAKYSIELIKCGIISGPTVKMPIAQ